MGNSIRKTVVAAVAALGMATAVATISTPAEAQFHGGGGFHGGGFHGGGFRGGGWGGGWRGGGWGRPGWGGGWGYRRAGWGWGGGWGGGCWNCGWGWGGGWGWGWDPGGGGGVGAGVGIRAGRSPRRPCPSESRSLRSRPMATVRVAGSGGASGQEADTILAGGLSTFAIDRLLAVSSDPGGPD
jgi:hypothetical protein